MLSGCTLFQDTVDNDPPKFTKVPDDKTCYRGDSVILIWSAKDANPSHYEIEYNGILVENHSWDNSDIKYTIENIETGIQSVVCTIFDKDTRHTSDEVTITVKSSVEKVIEETTPLFNYIVLAGSALSAALFIISVLKKRR